MKKSVLHRNRKLLIKSIFLLLYIGTTVLSSAQNRFPQPEFTEGYTYPELELEAPDPGIFDYIDSAVLLFALIAASFISYKYRRRAALLILIVFSLLYFGFYRQGCFCPIGTIQPVFEGLFRPDVSVPLVIIIFFTLPIVFALYKGRVFCSGVCPLGTLQDLLAIKPVQLPKPVAGFLSLFPPVFLSLSIISAITGSEYLICKFDPFVSVFRLSFGSSMALYTILWLTASVFIARPYCRFMCPYGFILKLTARLSKKELTCSPDACISCHLCKKSCPVDALHIPEETLSIQKTEKRTVKIKLLLVPVFIISGLFWGDLFTAPLSELHPDVRLYSQFENPNGDNELEREIFLATEDSLENLSLRADTAKEKWSFYLKLFGAILGFLFSLKLLLLESKKIGTEYKPKKGNCIHCLRCVEHCPVEHERRTRKKDMIKE